MRRYSCSYFFILFIICFLQCFVECLKHPWNRIRDNYRRCIQKPQLNQRSGAGSSHLPGCRYYEQLQYLYDTFSSDEIDGNVDIESLQRAFPNAENKVIEGEGSGMILLLTK